VAQGQRVQRLHLVGFTSELDALIFSARKGSRSGGYLITLDDQLLDSIREAIRLQTGEEPDLEGFDEQRAERSARTRRVRRVESALTPKEIQARLRGGRTVGQVAEEAEVDEEWIRRFAAPVLAEQSLIVSRALQLACRTNRRGESAEPLSESVALNLADRGILLTDDDLASGWSAYHVRESTWVVGFEYRSRRGAQMAQWAFDLTDSSLTPLNRLGTDLGYVEPGRKKRRPTLLEGSDERRGDAPARPPAVPDAGEGRPPARRAAGTAPARRTAEGPGGGQPVGPGQDRGR
jgi:hypothetical protein